MRTGLLSSAVLVTIAGALLWPTWVRVYAWLGHRRSAATLRLALVGLTLIAVSIGFGCAMSLGAAYERYERTFRPKAVTDAEGVQYSRYLWAMLLACPATMMVLLRRRLRPPRTGEALSAVAGLLAPVAAGALFLSVLPRKGNEGIVVLILVVPLAVAVLLLPLFVVSMILLVRSAAQGLNARHLRRSDRDLVCPQCGRSLAGNVNGRCPMCGRAVPDELWSTLGLPPRQSSAEAASRWAWSTILVIACDLVACAIAGVSFLRMMSGAGCTLLSAGGVSYPLNVLVGISPLLELIMAAFLWGAANGLRQHSSRSAASCRYWAIGYMLLSVFQTVVLPSLLAGRGPAGDASVLLRWSWVDTPTLAWLIACGIAFPCFLLFWFSLPSIRSEVASWSQPPGEEGRLGVTHTGS